MIHAVKEHTDFFWMEKENDDYLMTLNLKSQNARYQKITNHVFQSLIIKDRDVSISPVYRKKME